MSSLPVRPGRRVPAIPQYGARLKRAVVHEQRLPPRDSQPAILAQHSTALEHVARGAKRRRQAIGDSACVRVWIDEISGLLAPAYLFAARADAVPRPPRGGLAPSVLHACMRSEAAATSFEFPASASPQPRNSQLGDVNSLQPVRHAAPQLQSRCRRRRIWPIKHADTPFRRATASGQSPRQPPPASTARLGLSPPSPRCAQWHAPHSPSVQRWGLRSHGTRASVRTHRSLSAETQAGIARWALAAPLRPAVFRFGSASRRAGGPAAAATRTPRAGVQRAN